MLPIPNPIMFEVFGITIRWYGVLIVLAALSGAWIAGKQAARRGENGNYVWDALFLALIVGLIGARLYHVVSSPATSTVNFQFYLDNPLITVSAFGLQFPFPRVLAIWEGGLGIYGGIVGGILGLVVFLRWNKLSIPRWLDFGAVGLLLGQAIGRWGNYFNQELYGYPTNAPWGIPIDADHRLPQFTQFASGTWFHPTFLYESLLCLLGVLVLIGVSRRFQGRLLDGDIANLYLVVYPAIRLFTEFQRPDAWLFNGIPVAQLISGSLMAGAVVLFVVRHVVLHQKPAPVFVPAESVAPEGPQSPVRRKGRVLDPQKQKSRP